MSFRELKFGKYVLYNNIIGRINNNSKNEFIKIKTNDGELLEVNKCLLKPIPHDKGELIKYNNNYYLISEIKYDLNKNTINYKLSYVNKNNKNQEIIFINSNDNNIISINKDSQERTIKFLKFMDRYNASCRCVQKKTNIKMNYLNINDVDNNINLFFIRCKLRISQLDNISNTLKKTQNVNIELKNIYINPYKFITDDYQLINYDKAEKIENEFRLNINIRDKSYAWLVDLFLNQEKTFYISEYWFQKKIDKFCIEKKFNYSEFSTHINSKILKQSINIKLYNNHKNETYITTKKFLEIEEKITDLTLNLFNEKVYNIDDDSIIEFIHNYEKEQEKILNKIYKLDDEQITSVINSIKNKLSIITGPPGTGKTEVIKCILYVTSKLYKKNTLDIELSSLSDVSVSNYSDNYSDDYNDDIYEDDNEMVNKDESCNIYINNLQISLIAPTGLAYVNMQRQQSSKYYNNDISGTCHRTLYHTFDKFKKHRCLNNQKKFCGCETDDCEFKTDIKLIIVDEVSMIDIFLYEELIKMCKYFNTRLILLGDINQLPSIGPGLVLKKLIDCEIFNVNFLKKIKRQNSGNLVRNIIKMNNEIINKSDLTDDTMKLINIVDFYDTDYKSIKKDRILDFINENNLNKANTKFITYFKDKTKIFNTIILNNILQDIFNPLNEDFDKIPSNFKYENGYTFRLNDKIIRTENDYNSEKMRANGEEAEILDFDGRNVIIKYSGVNDKPEEISVNDLYDNFMLNYCVTIHKSQGSQYINVVFFIEPDQNIIDKQSMYTAISRAREKCFVISKDIDFIQCQKNDKTINKKISQFMEISNEYNFHSE